MGGWFRAILVGVTAVQPAAALAQPASGEAGNPVVLEDIVVTARRIEESPRTVPFGLSVLDRSVLDGTTVTGPADLAGRVPGFDFIALGTPTNSNSTLRGVGSLLPTGPDDASVPFYLAGVPLPSRVADLAFEDVARIEVLRGPQGTLFGRTAQAGAVNAVTPSAETRVREAWGGFGTEARRSAGALAGGALTDGAAARLRVSYEGRDGDVDNVVLGDRSSRAEDRVSAAGTVEARPSDDTTLKLDVRLDHLDQSMPSLMLRTDGDLKQGTDTRQPFTRRSAFAALTLEHRMEAMRLTSVSGAVGFDADYLYDDTDALVFAALTGAPPAAFNNPDTDFRRMEDREIQLSQELRLDGELEDLGTRWVAGAHGLWSRYSVDIRRESGGAEEREHNSHETATAALFGEVTQPLDTAERLRLIAGLRATVERKGFRSVFVGPTGLPFDQDSAETFSFLTGRLGLSYDLSDSVTAFATVARGVKAGGYPTTAVNAGAGLAEAPFREARTWSGEVGLKGDALDQRLRFAVSGFVNVTDDEHLLGFDLQSGTFEVGNVDTRSYGLEAEVAAVPAEGWTVATTLRVQSAALASDTPAGFLNGGEEGNRVPFTPDLTVSASLEYRTAVEDLWAAWSLGGSVYGRAEWIHTGSRAGDAANSFELDGYSLINLRLGWEGERAAVFAYADNLLDTRYETLGVNYGAALAAFPGDGRSLGLGASVKF